MQDVVRTKLSLWMCPNINYRQIVSVLLVVPLRLQLPGVFVRVRPNLWMLGSRPALMSNYFDRFRN